ncbi:hypothetical protein OROHE_019670 [Orobanche hederae]
MKEAEKQRKFHEALLKMLYPPPPTSPSRQEDEEEEEETLIESSSHLPEEGLEIEERYSSPSSGHDNEGDNGGTEKLTRAKRKRLRKRKLKEAALQPRKIIGPLLPGSYDGKNDVVGNVPASVRQNAAIDISGETASCSKQNKVRKRRTSKNLSGKS